MRETQREREKTDKCDRHRERGNRTEMKLRGRDRQRQERQETDGDREDGRSKSRTAGRQGEEVNAGTDGGCHSFTLYPKPGFPRTPSSLLTSWPRGYRKKGKFQGHSGRALWSYEASSMTLNSVLPPLKKRVVMVVGVELLSHV